MTDSWINEDPLTEEELRPLQEFIPLGPEGTTKYRCIINLDTPDNTEEAKRLIALVEPYRTYSMQVNGVYAEMFARVEAGEEWNVHRHGFKFWFFFRESEDAIKFGLNFPAFSYRVL